MYYSELLNSPINSYNIRRLYGVDPVAHSGRLQALKIFPLTENPTTAVIGYQKTTYGYRPLRDYRPEVKAAERRASLYLSFLRRATGTWMAGREYEEGDIVEFEGRHYKALINAVATAQTEPTDGTDRWEELQFEGAIAIDGYYPLYFTEDEANEVGNGTSHSHDFDGITYYMPDDGIDTYHGSYENPA